MNRALDILAIDIDAALRKLTEKRFKNRDEPALALIRFAASTHPNAIVVSREKARFVVEAASGRFNTELFTWLQILFDSGRPKSQRSQVLSRLENHIGLDVLAAFAGAPRAVRFTYPTETGAETLGFAPDTRPRRRPSALERTLRIEVDRGLARKADPAVLTEKCRFAEIPIVIDDKRVSRGIKLEGSLIRQQLTTAPVTGVVGIPKEGDLSHIIILDNGVISDELYMPSVRGIVFDAVVSGKRSDFLDFYPVLRQAAKRLLPHLASGYAALAPDRARHAEARLFDRYEVTRDESLVAGVTAFVTAQKRRIDLPTILAASGKTQYDAVDDFCALSRHAVHNREVLVLSQKQRRFLDAVLESPLKTPPKRIAATLRSKGLGERLRDLRTRLGGQPDLVPDAELTETERRFIDTLTSGVRRREVTFAVSLGGRLPERPRRDEDATCYPIPRSHPALCDIMAAVLDNPALIRPAVALFTDGEIVPRAR